MNYEKKKKNAEKDKFHFAQIVYQYYKELNRHRWHGGPYHGFLLFSGERFKVSDDLARNLCHSNLLLWENNFSRRSLRKLRKN